MRPNTIPIFDITTLTEENMEFDLAQCILLLFKPWTNIELICNKSPITEAYRILKYHEIPEETHLTSEDKEFLSTFITGICTYSHAQQCIKEYQTNQLKKRIN
jgi:hypothetical protein